jgi:hypothetical protein
LSDYWATVNAFIDNGEIDGTGLQESQIKPTVKLISISSVLLNTKSNYQDFQRLQVVDIEMAADAEATLPALIEAVKQTLPSGRKAAIEARGAGNEKAWSEARDRTRQAAAYAWDCESDQHRADGDGSLRADQGSRLVLGRRRPPAVKLAEPVMADGKVLSPHRWPGRLRNRVWSTGCCRGGAGLTAMRDDSRSTSSPMAT